MAAGQLQQLKSILGYAILYSRFYRQHLKGLDIRDLDFDGFSKLILPVMAL
ncbi:MAG: hypothetical protein HOF74_04395 [Gammaproteobacteria bacterium]|jgi:hypothetical protein|nr:hypothetical protein [Gammaproteobacteria bacterium]MBT3859048.1 hypothetical protein [Gammaproteobacteria bacterium]MBT3987841.1 hypothetical protein [Gammaproteobacteria bacterium]MBT4254450.1 hypothetical protein [Gammaproteobacteria bacterium]MBT4581512.1 hypothetical protein [Gammaproteobacteria bacterium]